MRNFTDDIIKENEALENALDYEQHMRQCAFAELVDIKDELMQNAVTIDRHCTEHNRDILAKNIIDLAYRLEAILIKRFAVKNGKIQEL